MHICMACSWFICSVISQELDCLLSRHVMSLHSAPANASRPSNQLVTSVTVRRNSTNVRTYVRMYVVIALICMYMTFLNILWLATLEFHSNT